MADFVKITDLPTGSALNGSEFLEAVQSNNSVRITTTQLLTYILKAMTQSENYTLAATGTQTLNWLAPNSTHDIALTAGSSGNVATAQLNAQGAGDGNQAFVIVQMPAVNGQSFQLQDNTGAAIATVSSIGAAFQSLLVCFYSSTTGKWTLASQSA